MRILLWGVGLTAVVTSVLLARFGREALLPGVVMGAVATGIELAAARSLIRGQRTSTQAMIRAFAAGMLFRMLGVGLFAGLVLWDRGLFPPLATGLGLLAVLVPLLLLEVRLIR